MRYVVDLNGHRSQVDVNGETVTVGAFETVAHVEEVEGTPVRLVTIGREVHRVIVRRGATRGAYTMWVDGYRFEGEAVDERTRAIRDVTAASSKPTGPAPVVAPMPGMIVRVTVAVGDAVQAGQGVVVMEAMKMENELRASAGGKVKTVLVSPGTAVEKGAILVELEGGDSASTAGPVSA